MSRKDEVEIDIQPTTILLLPVYAVQQPQEDCLGNHGIATQSKQVKSEFYAQ